MPREQAPPFDHLPPPEPPRVPRASGRLERINVSAAGGVPKSAVPAAAITPKGVEGDRQRNRLFHGGPTRAVSLFAAEVIARLAAEGHPIAAGVTGENLTISGLPWQAIGVGARLQIGADVEVRITSFAAPCKTIAGAFSGRAFARISQKRHPGESRLYAEVLAAGTVREGDEVLLF